METFFWKNYFLPETKYRGKPEHIRYPALASLKLDGELQYLIVKNGRAITVNKSKYGRVRRDYPVTREAVCLPDGIYLGELYWNEGRTLQDFYGLLARKADDNLKLAIWGVLEYGYEKNIDTVRTVEILEKIRPLLPVGGYVSVVPYWWVKNKEELYLLAREILACGWEGLVVRNPGAVYIGGTSSDWVKVKARTRRDK
ncbi:MAG: hypothetical protein AB1330_00985 [Bacillota bacterium]